MQEICDDLVIKIGDLPLERWIFGHKDIEITQIIAIHNFAIYKAYIMSMSGYSGPMWEVIQQTLQSYTPVVKAIRIFDLI